MKPYIVRFISSRSGTGKTLVASKIVDSLVKRGFPVGVIKHATTGISLEEKDSEKYLRAGATEVIVSNKEITLAYNKGLVDDLGELVGLISKPLIIAEGFKESNVGDTVVVAKEIEDAAGLVTSSTIAVVITESHTISENHRVDGAPILQLSQLDVLADRIIEKAVRYITNQLPGLNCGHCGLSTCEALALRILKGEKASCPLSSQVKLSVNNIEIQLNPFVMNVMISVVEGLLRALKGVPKNIKEIELKIAMN